jgi:predicted DCC family thiol-disulfide oxidoreductase YuxK
MRVPPLRWIAHGVYRLVANNRDRMPGGTAACKLPAAQRPGAGSAS